jgi:hypothetical protein
MYPWIIGFLAQMSSLSWVANTLILWQPCIKVDVIKPAKLKKGTYVSVYNDRLMIIYCENKKKKYLSYKYHS